MRTQHDQFAKSLLAAMLEGCGTVLPEHEVQADAQTLDVCFLPATPWHEEADLGVLGRMARKTSAFEAEHNTPTTLTVLHGLRRQLT